MTQRLSSFHLFQGPGAVDTLPAPLRPIAMTEGHRLCFHRVHDRWHCLIELPEIPANTLVVPSLILADHLPDLYTMRFMWADSGIDLAPISLRPNTAINSPKAHMNLVVAAGMGVCGGLDCVETRDALVTPRLLLQGTGAAPTDAILLLSVRTRHMDIHDDGAISKDLAIPGFSQMARSPEIARHLCSPVAIAMVLAAAGRSVDLETFARSCEHPHHRKLFGLWPLNLARARREGFSGLVRLFDNVSEAARLLDAGYPVVTSLRFAVGALPSAPLPETGGHLVVLRGLGADTVLVNDPAAPGDKTVARQYDRAAFLKAWLADRGVAYLLWPRPEREEPLV